ncbi:MAG: glycogen-binding domain-containing protein [Bacteroidales bacterium]|nr:glycogen-binding domain-containing protein [Bacteroidales bacterium]
MKTKTIYLFLLLLVLLNTTLKAQFDPSKICRLEDNRLIFQLNSDWTDAQKKEVLQLFDLDSVLFVKAFEGVPIISVDSITWQISIITSKIVEASKMLSPPPVPITNMNDVFHVGIQWPSKWNEVENDVEAYGVNAFTKNNAFRFSDQHAVFFLPGFTENKKVFISGSFNNWSTMQSPMIKTDSGWIFKIWLKPGKYTYKYIIDGKWKQDPNNRLKEDDTQGGYNSIVFVYNHLFRLTGYNNARKVILSGSFNNWKENELQMKPVAEGWELPLFLREGTYTYKFIVDKTWINDPDNPHIRPDGKGNLNSCMAIGDTMIFYLNGFLQAKEVKLAGSFNNWNPGELLMFRDSTGWNLPYVLAKGNYEYKFIVDGNWIQDPANPFVGGYNQDGNSIFSFKPNYVFQLDSFPDAKKVVVAGSFNNWNPDNYRMIRKEGKWIFPLYLKPGKHTYKFIVDGQWILDPFNELWEENEYNTHNSLLWIE